jgi:hypothetical protein
MYLVSYPSPTSIFLTFLNWAIIAYTQNHELGVFLYGMQYWSRPQTSGKYEYLAASCSPVGSRRVGDEPSMYYTYRHTYHLWYLVGISMEKSCGACSVYSCCMHARTWYIEESRIPLEQSSKLGYLSWITTLPPSLFGGEYFQGPG